MWAAGIAAYPLLALALPVLFWLRPLALLGINDALKPYTDFALPASLGGVKIPLRHLLLVGSFTIGRGCSMHLSEMSAATRARIRPEVPDLPANALVVTSRLEEPLGGVSKAVIRPLRISGRQLSIFVDAYLTRPGKRDLFDDPEYVEGFIAASRRKQLKPVLEMLVADPELIGREMVEDVLRYKRLDGAGAALRAVAGAAFAGGRQAARFDGRLGELKVPVQVIWGKEDRIVPAAHARNAPPNVQVHVLDGAGHMVHMEKAAEVNRLIAGLIRG